jgi:hypothetical protein
MSKTQVKWRVIPMAIAFWFVVGIAVVQAEPVAVAPEPSHTFPTVVEGNEVVHDFVIQNKGNETLEIQKVQTG